MAEKDLKTVQVGKVIVKGVKDLSKFVKELRTNPSSIPVSMESQYFINHTT